MSIQQMELPSPTSRIVKKAKLANVGDLDVAIETITPSVAEAYLGTQRVNRRISYRTVDAYAKDMIAGRWRTTGDAIRFDEAGHLIDGQHRLKACVKCGLPLTTIVIRNLTADANQYVDIGRARRAQDAASILGFPQGGHLGSAARLLIAIREYHLSKAAHTFSSRISVPEIMEFVERHPDLIESVRASEKPVGVSKTIASSFHYILWKDLADREIADEFSRVLKTGVPYYDGDAVQAWREKCIRLSQTRHSNIKMADAARGMMQAINHWIKASPILRWKHADETYLKGYHPGKFD